MPYKFDVSQELRDKLENLSKKDKQLYERTLKKIDEIVNCFNIEYYKNLKYTLKDSKRVHIGHFVLVFRFDKANNLIIFYDFDHHDKIYRR